MHMHTKCGQTSKDCIFLATKPEFVTITTTVHFNNDVMVDKNEALLHCKLISFSADHILR